MNARLLSASLCCAAVAVAALPLAALADDASSSSSSSSSSASSDPATEKRVERCKRFSKGDDYERCVRLIRRQPFTGSSSSASSSEPAAGFDWKWTNILNRIEEKLKSTVKFVSVLARQFCKDQTEDNATTSRECMSRFKGEMQTRMAKIIDEAFRGDLPSSR